MNIIYKYCEGSQTSKPAEIDNFSSKTVVYLRKNIHSVTKEEQDGKTNTLWGYEEAIITPEEYEKFKIEKMQADIDYLSALIDIEL